MPYNHGYATGYYRGYGYGAPVPMGPARDWLVGSSRLVPQRRAVAVLLNTLGVATVELPAGTATLLPGLVAQADFYGPLAGAALEQAARAVGTMETTVASAALR